MRQVLVLSIVLGAGSAFAAGPPRDKDPPLGHADKQKLEERLKKLVGKPPEPIVNLHNIWTQETLVIGAKAPEVTAPMVDTFLRCHFTDEPTHMDERLINVLFKAARRFRADRIDVVSGFRSPKFNLMLRKKGHEVARDSQHTYGHAVDFRIPGIGTRKLLSFVRSLHLGGAGFYPESEFVHADTGPIRFWAGR